MERGAELGLPPLLPGGANIVEDTTGLVPEDAYVEVVGAIGNKPVLLLFGVGPVWIENDDLSTPLVPMLMLVLLL